MTGSWWSHNLFICTFLCKYFYVQILSLCLYVSFPKVLKVGVGGIGEEERMKRTNGARTRRKPLIFIGHRACDSTATSCVCPASQAALPWAKHFRSSRPAGWPRLASILRGEGVGSCRQGRGRATATAAGQQEGDCKLLLHRDCPWIKAAVPQHLGNKTPKEQNKKQPFAGTITLSFILWYDVWWSYLICER